MAYNELSSLIKLNIYADLLQPLQLTTPHIPCHLVVNIELRGFKYLKWCDPPCSGFNSCH